MSQRDNFSVGFLVGAMLGGVVGGVLGVVLSSRRLEVSASEESLRSAKQDAKAGKPRKRPLNPANEKTIEVARRSLEDKIAQLNDAIDDVRQQLGNVNGGVTGEGGERSLAKEP
jgi:hypothetical protein